VYLVILKSPGARFPYLVGNFPKKREAQVAKVNLENEGLRKGQYRGGAIKKGFKRNNERRQKAF
jgi:hypothetical protein